MRLRTKSGYSVGDFGLSIACFAVGFFFLDYWPNVVGLAGAQATTLVVDGSHDLAAEGAFGDYATIILNATALRVEDAGHESLLDRSEIVLDAVDGFLGGATP